MNPHDLFTGDGIVPAIPNLAQLQMRENDEADKEINDIASHYNQDDAIYKAPLVVFKYETYVYFDGNDVIVSEDSLFSLERFITIFYIDGLADVSGLQNLEDIYWTIILYFYNGFKFPDVWTDPRSPLYILESPKYNESIPTFYSFRNVHDNDQTTKFIYLAESMCVEHGEQALSTEAITAAIYREYQSLFMAYEDNEMIGFVIFSHKDIVTIEILCSRHKGRGVGGELIKRVIDLADNKIVKLDSVYDKIDFYKHLGFVMVDEDTQWLEDQKKDWENIDNGDLFEHYVGDIIRGYQDEGDDMNFTMIYSPN